MKNLVFKIRNFQSLSDLTFPVGEGITVIVGSNSVGKSATLRAVKGLLLNSTNSRQVRLNQQEPLFVQATFEDEEGVPHEVSISRSLGGSSPVSYVVDGEVFRKVGRSSLEEVTSLTHVKELDIPSFDKPVSPSFWMQGDPPFLLDLSPSKVYDFFATEPELLAALRQLKEEAAEESSRVKSTDSKISYLAPEIKSDELRLASFREEAEILFPVEGLEKIADRLDALSDLRRDISTVISSRNSLCSSLEVSRNRLSVLESLPTFSKLHSLRSRIKEIRPKVQSLSFLSSEMDSLLPLSGMLLPDSSTAKLAISLRSKLSSIRGKKSELLSSNRDLISLRARLSDIDRELAGYNYCPLCGSSIGGHTHL